MQKPPTTHKRVVRLVVDIEPSLFAKIERDRDANGNCSRGAIIRMALRARYELNRHGASVVSEEASHGAAR